MPIFSKGSGVSTKTPSETVRILVDSLNKLGRTDLKEKERDKELETIHKLLSHMKAIVAGDEPMSEQINQLCTEVYHRNLLPLLLLHMDKVGFESRKLANEVFYHLINRRIGTRRPTCDYLMEELNQKFIFDLVLQYEKGQEVALPCGNMIRYCIKVSDDLTKLILTDPSFFNFFKYVELQPFDISSDAFSTFKDLLTMHKETTAQFLESNYEQFFENYKLLLDSGNYVTKRQSLKLLGELLLERHNFTVMTKYISSADNLKQIMMLLRDASKSIQFETFHVFKVFVANPHKTKEVKDILLKNREKLVEFLTKFQNDKHEDDQQFSEEKAYLIKQIKDMVAPNYH